MEDRRSKTAGSRRGGVDESKRSWRMNRETDELLGWYENIDTTELHTWKIIKIGHFMYILQ